MTSWMNLQVPLEAVGTSQEIGDYQDRTDSTYTSSNDMQAGVAPDIFLQVQCYKWER